MNQKNTNKKNTVKWSADDLQLYRLFCILGAAVLGFAAFHFISYATFFKVLEYGQWVTLALSVLAIGALCYIRLVKKPDESEKLITSTGVAYFVIPVLLLLTCFRQLEDPIFKCQVVFGFLSVFAVICNIFKNEIKVISAVTFLSLASLYYASHPLYTWLEIALNGISKVMIFLIPAILLAVALFSKLSKKMKDSIKDRFGAVLCVIMGAVLLASALVLLIVPAIFLYVMISVLVVYVVIGIVCTIRLI